MCFVLFLLPRAGSTPVTSAGTFKCCPSRATGEREHERVAAALILCSRSGGKFAEFAFFSIGSIPLLSCLSFPLAYGMDAPRSFCKRIILILRMCDAGLPGHDAFLRTSSFRFFLWQDANTLSFFVETRFSLWQCREPESAALPRCFLYITLHSITSTIV